MEIKSRKITVNVLQCLAFSREKTQFSCNCGKGTYIRSLARDIGWELGCFGYISVLRRTKVGNFGENDAIHQRVDGRVLDPDIVARALLVRGLRRPIIALLISGWFFGREIGRKNVFRRPRKHGGWPRRRRMVLRKMRVSPLQP